MKRLLTVLCALSLALAASAQGVVEKTDTLAAARVSTDRKQRDEAATQTGLQRLDASKINRGFALLGSPDVIKTLQNLPGVAAGTELMSGLYVHGGDGTDNLFLLDGAPIYQVSHLIGLFSSFNSDLVDQVDFYKSGFPARYGGRASSVVDVRTRDGNFDEYHGTFAIGAVDGRLQFEGPIIRGKTSFNVGLRRSWSDLVTTPLIAVANNYERRENGNRAEQYSMGYNFTDFNARVTHLLGPDNRLFLSLYGGIDKLKLGSNSPNVITEGDDETGRVFHYGENKLGARIAWGNMLAALGWNAKLTDNLYIDATAYWSRNLNDISFDLYDRSWDLTLKGDVTDTYREAIFSNVSATGAKASMHLNAGESHTLRFGLMSQYRHYHPERNYAIGMKSAVVDTVDSGATFVDFKAFEGALYAEDEIRITPWLTANVGLRDAVFEVAGKWWNKLEPRAAVKFQCGPNTSIRASYTMMSQFDHRISTLYLDLPTNTMMPSTSIMKPMTSQQVAAGVYSSLPFDLKLTLEGWYKTMDNMYEYNGISTLYPPITTWEREFVEGRGKSYGLEFGAEYATTRLSLQAYYTLSWSWRKFDDFYFDWYPDRNDNRHKIDLLANYRWGNGFELYAGWHYHTGNNVTGSSYRILLSNDGKVNYAQGLYERPNNLKLPDYHRLDLGFNWHNKTARGNEGVFNISIYNAYCRLNAVLGYVTEEAIWTDNMGYVPTGRMIGEATGIVPIIPTIGYTLKF